MKRKTRTTKSVGELADALGLSRANGVEISVRSAINRKIVDEFAHRGCTHADLAAIVGTSRTRITAILNYNTQDVSTDLLLRVLDALGVTAKITFRKAA